MGLTKLNPEIFVPIWSWTSVAIKSKAIAASISLTSSHSSSYKCLRRCQKHCTKNLVPLAEAKFIFEMIQGILRVVFLLCSHLTHISCSFADYSTIFNGNVVTAAKAVVCPLDAEDVSKYVFSRLLPQ